MVVVRLESGKIGCTNRRANSDKWKLNRRLDDEVNRLDAKKLMNLV